VLDDSSKKQLSEASVVYQAMLRDEPAVHEYLTGRGYNGVSAQYFNLGYVGEPYPGHEPYVGRMAIPYQTPTGIVQIKFRAIPGLTVDEKPKYLGLPGRPPLIYNARDLLAAGEVAFICEGESDTWAVRQATGLPTTGIPGVSTWRPYMARCYAGFQVVIVPDADPPNEQSGQRPGEQLVRAILEDIPHARVVRLPEGHDASSFIASDGVDAFTERIPL